MSRLSLAAIAEYFWPFRQPGQTVEPADASPWERRGRLLLAVLILVGCPLFLARVMSSPTGTDFPEFHAAGQYVLDHGARQPDTILAFYLPSLDVAWAGLAWLPMPIAAFVWYLAGSLAWLGLLGAVNRYLLVDLVDATRRQALLAAGLLMMPLVLDHLCQGAFHILMLWLMVEGLGRASRGRPYSGGMLLGLAAWVKLLPILAVGYLVIKRKWRPAAVAVATLLVVDVALSLAAFGPRAAWRYHETWWHEQATGTTARMLTSDEAIKEQRYNNQSLVGIMRRSLTQLGLKEDTVRNHMALGNLSPMQLKTVYMATMGVLGLSVLFLFRRPAAATSAGQWSTEISLLVLATMWFSPVVWTYHFTAATPALAVALGRNPPHKRLAWSMVAFWTLALALTAWDLARGFGEMLWFTFLLGGVVIWTKSARAEADSRPCTDCGCGNDGQLPHECCGGRHDLVRLIDPPKAA